MSAGFRAVVLVVADDGMIQATDELVPMTKT